MRNKENKKERNEKKNMKKIAFASRMSKFSQGIC